MVDFTKLKNKSGKASLEKLTQELSKLSQKQHGGKDERFWKPTVDKAGNGYAVLRFLPAHDDDDDKEFVRLWDHGFQGPSGSWYFENSLTTIGKADPVSEFNSKLWNTGLESDKDLARKYRRRLNFIVRIFVVTDKGNPENEGKVFYWKIGKKLFKKLEEAMNPEFEDETPLNPFDLWEGANFLLKIRQVEGYRNYDKSEFSKQGPLAADDEMFAIMEQADALPLLPFIAPDQFKAYDVLKEKFEKVLSGVPGPQLKAADNVQTDAPVIKSMEARPLPEMNPEDEDDETTKWFASLAEDE